MKKLFKEVNIGDTVRLPDVSFTIQKIEPLDGKIPSQSSEQLFVVHTQAASGPLRGFSGQFVITGNDKIEMIRRYPRMRRFFEWLSKNRKKPKKKADVPLSVPPLFF